jgi:hypothetical protein
MAGKAKVKRRNFGPNKKATTTLVHSIRWEREEFRRIEQRAKELTEETRLRMAPQDVVRIAVREYLNGGEK